MNDKKTYKFIFNWVLINKLAVGTSPLNQDNISFLKNKGINNILGLCLESEVGWAENISKNFCCERIFIPDSKSEALPNFKDLSKIFNTLTEFLENGATFVHCFASVERSPLICILYVMQKFNLELEDALDYVLRKHDSTNPTNTQLKVINEFRKNLSKEKI